MTIYKYAVVDKDESLGSAAILYDSPIEARLVAQRDKKQLLELTFEYDDCELVEDYTESPQPIEEET
jgi:hypothetical protein